MDVEWVKRIVVFMYVVIYNIFRMVSCAVTLDFYQIFIVLLLGELEMKVHYSKGAKNVSKDQHSENYVERKGEHLASVRIRCISTWRRSKLIIYVYLLIIISCILDQINPYNSLLDLTFYELIYNTNNYERILRSLNIMLKRPNLELFIYEHWINFYLFVWMCWIYQRSSTR